MPLSELYGTTKGKVEGSQQKTVTCSNDLSLVRPGNELVELVWENGQIMMQGQSSRSRKNPKIPTSNNFPFQKSRFRDRDIASQAAAKAGKYGTVDSIYSDIVTALPSGEMGLNQDDDMVPWFNYPIEDTLHQDYCSDFLPELSSVTVNEPSLRSSSASMDKRDCPSKFPPSRSAQLYPWSLPHGQTSVGSRVSDIISSNTTTTYHDISGNLVSSQAPVGQFSQVRMQKQDAGLHRSNPALLNFSHFSRPVAMARANIQNASAVSSLVSSCADAMKETEKVLPASFRIPAESTHNDPNFILHEEMNFQTQTKLVSTKIDSKPVDNKPFEEPHAGGQSNNVCQEDAIKNDRSPNQDLGLSTAKGVSDNDKITERVGASSVCSGNSVERASNDPTVNLKRKSCRHIEDSEGQSEDAEEESVRTKKATPARGGSGSKRSRAAEVHNLSERRRRDRINEKMRALQELIPNCNKVDKASMLDEAIEYLKTLQLQVQIMSMGAGLYMSPMMLPTGMQHIHASHLPHFSPMGMGMGMGMGFGMNMLDMNGRSRGCSMIPMPPMQGAHFPTPPLSGSTSFQGMAGTNLPVYGHPPCQGLPISVPGAPLAPISGRPQINPASGMNSLRTGVNVEAVSAAPNNESKDLTESTNSDMMHSADANISLNQQCSQTTNERFDQRYLPSKNEQATDAGGSAAVNSTRTNGAAVPSGEASCG